MLYLASKTYIHYATFLNLGGDGQPTLLSFDDAVTLFHEFGHGLHGMLSKVTYERLSGTSVLKDFVELVGDTYIVLLSDDLLFCL